MINLVHYMTKEIWDSMIEMQQMYGGHPVCFDNCPPQKWITNNDKKYKYIVLSLPDYDLNNTHIYGQFAKCNNCGNYYSGWDDFRKEYDDRPKKCLICDGNILQENNNFLI